MHAEGRDGGRRASTLRRAPSNDAQKRSRGFTARELTTFALLAALLLALQVALAPLPNVELVSLLIALYTRRYGAKALLIVYTFVLLEGFIYGFGLWFVNYLYVWAVLWALAMALRGMKGVAGWVMLLGAYGLGFGLLCAVPYVFIGGFGYAVSYFISGIPFDITHGISNAALAALLFKPLGRALSRAA